MSQKLKIKYPSQVLEEAESLSRGFVFPYSNETNEEEIGSLLITVNTDDLDFFGVRHNHPTPGIKFRMLDIMKMCYLIEIILYFDNGKNLRLHLSPKNAAVVKYLKKIKANEKLAFTFFVEDTNEVINAMTFIGWEEVEWIKRNLKLIKKLKPRNQYKLVSSNLEKYEVDKIHEKVNKFHRVIGQEYFVDSCSELIIID